MTLPPNRADHVAQWETDQLILILLRQFKRLLADRDIALTDKTMRQIATTAADHQPTTAMIAAICDVLATLVIESEQVLASFGMASYAQALKTEMTDLDWQTTAEFLEVANEKVNAEMRINTGAALMTLLSDYRHAQRLLDSVDHDLHTLGHLDVDAMIARRALLHGAQVPPDQADWLDQIRDWLNANPPHPVQ